MKECGILQIETNSIRTYLEDIFNKSVEDILISDLLLVETLTIDGRDDGGKKTFVSFQDLYYFKNLKFLEIKNCYVGNSVINMLSRMNYLRNIIFRNCSFGKNVVNLNRINRINCLKIIDCKGFNDLLINKLAGVKRLYLAGIRLDNFNCFIGVGLQSLDVSCSFFKNIDGISRLDTNYLVLGKSQYNKFKRYFDLLKCKIMVMADYREGYYIEKWIN